MKIFFILYFFSFGIFNSFSQGYESLFGTTSTAWKIVIANLWGTGTDSLRTGSDTIINSLQYKIIHSDYITYNPQNIHGFLREDTISGRAWYKGWYSPSPPLGDSTERLIMDMSLAVGDSFYLYPYATPWPLDSGWIKADSVYYISGKKYIRFADTTYFGDKVLFIEGVGPNLGVQYMSEPLNASPYLLCYYRDNQKLYSNSNPNFKECDLLTSIIEASDSKQLISIFPHPVTNISTFQFHNPLGTLFTLNIYDVFGKRIKQYATTADKINIENGNIADGIYYYQLVSSINNIPELSGKIIFINQK